MAASTPPTPSVEVRLARKDELPATVAAITSGLLVEPGFTALVPDQTRRRKVMTSLMTGIATIAQSRDALYIALDQGTICGAAIWAPAGTYPFDLRTNLRMMPHILKLITLGPSKLSQLAGMDTAAAKHFPKEPAWYLQALGVSPDHQGKGVGSAILRTSLKRVDQDGTPAYLETTGEANIRLYQRFGFAIRDENVHLVPENLGVSHVTMLRPPSS